ncbi:MAG: hypothetical protein H0X33_03610 [Taibaiella sp.]|nr:hypothetical protein [Taibaiella sp.]
MSQKRKISIRKVVQVFVTLVTCTACTMGILSASKIENKRKLTGINIYIQNGNKYHFINKGDVMNMLIASRHIDVAHLTMSNLDIHTMENIVLANPWVADAQVYVDNTHKMHVNIVQRVPVARVFEANGNSYYLDTSLKTLPLSSGYVYYTTVVTNVPELHNDSTGASVKTQIIALVRQIEKDTFWRAQVSQIIMDSTGSFELVPVLGNQRILLGDTSNMKDKFASLFLFYKKVLNRVGWDKYEILDLRYNGQVVASPALAWKAPVDKAMSNMNWVKAVIDEGAKKEGADTSMAKVPAIKPLQPKDAVKKEDIKTNNNQQKSNKNNKPFKKETI